MCSKQLNSWPLSFISSKEGYAGTLWPSCPATSSTLPCPCMTRRWQGRKYSSPTSASPRSCMHVCTNFGGAQGLLPTADHSPDNLLEVQTKDHCSRELPVLDASCPTYLAPISHVLTDLPSSISCPKSFSPCSK